jgi:1,4-dihydroxy-2-naphthoate octaprenyltransferase
MAAILIWGGAVLYLIGVVWLIYLAWTNSQPLMAVGIFFLGIIFGPIYALQNFDEAKIPLGILVVGFVMRVAGIFVV